MDSSRPIEAVLSHYPDARKSGAEWVAHCTGHRDTESSLSIREAEDGRVLLHCYVGSDKPAILRPFGLSLSDLYPPHEGASRPGDKPKWREEYTQYLKERLPAHRFTLLPDNDGAGQAHAEHVARSLTAAGLQANILKLPGLAEKGDASDWFDAGNDAAK